MCNQVYPYYANFKSNSLRATKYPEPEAAVPRHGRLRAVFEGAGNLLPQALCGQRWL